MKSSYLTIILCTVFQRTSSYSSSSSSNHHHELDERGGGGNNDIRKNNMDRQRSHCFSCASFVYLPHWSQLMHHYYPPKNFTDRCWQPDSGIGLVPCSSACFTLVERIDNEEILPGAHDAHGVMRGCMDRLLLFGIDDDVRNIFNGFENQRMCRHTDRKLLRLFPMSPQTDVVTFCSCNGDFCNEQDMLRELSSSNTFQFHVIIFLISIFYFL